MIDGIHDDPAWVILVQRLRAVSEQYGEGSEIGWLANLAARQIVADNQRLAQLTD